MYKLLSGNLDRNIYKIFKFSHSFLSTKQTRDVNFQKHVYISQSTDIFSNLALEDWFYQNADFQHQQILMLWRSKPCVVIGRHQNPWLECNVELLDNLTKEGVKLARRNSGGGTVYHDEGNLNVTFFSTREHYNRKHNLEIIKRAMFREYGLNVNVSKREDLTLRNHKISGTASRFGAKNAFHHCTLLVDVNKENLRNVLHRHNCNFETTASRSIKSSVINLREENRNITIERLKSAIGQEFLQCPIYSKHKHSYKNTGFHLINPTDVWFPGLKKLRDDLVGWKWIFEMCPKFTDVRVLEFTDSKDERKMVELRVLVEKGRICDVNFKGLEAEDFTNTRNLILPSVVQIEYSSHVIDNIIESSRYLLQEKYVLENVAQM